MTASSRLTKYVRNAALAASLSVSLSGTLPELASHATAQELNASTGQRKLPEADPASLASEARKTEENIRALRGRIGEYDAITQVWLLIVTQYRSFVGSYDAADLACVQRIRTYAELHQVNPKIAAKSKPYIDDCQQLLSRKTSTIAYYTNAFQRIRLRAVEIRQLSEQAALDLNSQKLNLELRRQTKTLRDTMNGFALKSKSLE